MVSICKYKSPLGDILLAADEIGLTGLWFEGQNYFADTLPNEHIQQETEILTETKNGWICILPGKNRNLLRIFILQDQNSDRQCGKSYYRYPTVRRFPTEQLPEKWLR